MRLIKLLSVTLAIVGVMTFCFAAGRAAASPQNEEGALISLPFTYSGTNGGAEDLALDFTPSNMVPNSGTLTVDGGTPGGAGLLAVSFAQADVAAFGLSFLIATDPVNLANYFYFGFDATGALSVPNVSQNYPFLSGTNVYMQAYEYAPGAKTSNGLVFPLL